LEKTELQRVQHSEKGWEPL